MGLLLIDKAFDELIAKPSAHRLCKITANSMQQIRWRHRHRNNVSYNTKIRLLQLSGWRDEDARYTKKQLLSVLKFAITQNKHTRAMGPAYVLEKFELAFK